jgi:hypothetical protein
MNRDHSPTSVEIASAWVNNMLKPELQLELRAREQPINGNKPELTMRLNEVLFIY